MQFEEIALGKRLFSESFVSFRKEEVFRRKEVYALLKKSLIIIFSEERFHVKNFNPHDSIDINSPLYMPSYEYFLGRKCDVVSLEKKSIFEKIKVFLFDSASIAAISGTYGIAYPWLEYICDLSIEYEINLNDLFAIFSTVYLVNESLLELTFKSSPDYYKKILYDKNN